MKQSRPRTNQSHVRSLPLCYICSCTSCFGSRSSALVAHGKASNGLFENSAGQIGLARVGYGKGHGADMELWSIVFAGNGVISVIEENKAPARLDAMCFRFQATGTHRYMASSLNSPVA